MSALQPIEQKQVLFYEDQITAVRLKDGRVMIPLRPICTALGLSWPGQQQRVNRDSVLSSEVMSVCVTHTDIDPSSRQPRTSDMLCIPLDFLSGFLFGVNASRVKPEIKDRLIRYQRECYRVLAEAFQSGRLTSDTTYTDIMESGSAAAVAYRMASAVAEIARNQFLLEQQYETLSIRTDAHEARLEQLEGMLQPGGTVTEAQASQISQAVKAVAMVLSKKTRKNEYGGVYGEMYRRFEITSYKLLPAAKFEKCMKWLTDWHQDIAGEGPF